jgi:hypothetical protein
MTVVTFTSYVPPARTGDVWNRARIEEAGSSSGPFTPIDTITLSPLDADPRYPRSRTFSTEHAAGTGLWYRVVWLDVTNDESSPTEALQNLSTLESLVRPTVQDVADLILARTKTTGGGTARMFTDSTPVTAEEVERHVAAAAGLVISRIGELPADDDCTHASTLRGGIRTLIAMRAALFVEPSQWPSETASDRSAYDALWTQWLDDMKAIVDAVIACRTGAQPGPTDGGVVPPADGAWWYPADMGGLVGWGSRW